MASSAHAFLAIASLLSGVAAKHLRVHSQHYKANVKYGIEAASRPPFSDDNYRGDNAALNRGHEVAGKPCLNTIPVSGSAKPMPAIGYLTFGHPYPSEDSLADSIMNYLNHGGRLLDTALEYGTEHIVGTVVKNSGIPRADVWVTSKVDVCHSPDTRTREWVASQIDQSLQNVGLDYIDVMNLHWGPAAIAANPPSSRCGSQNMTRDKHVEIWKGLIDAKRAGKVLNIGVNEHTQSEIENLKLATGEAPAVAMFLHTPLGPAVQNNYVSWLQSEGIAVQIYGAFDWATGSGKGMFPSQLKVLEAVSQHSGLTLEQVVIRWALDHNMAVTTEMYDPQHVKEHLDCSGVLTSSDYQMLTAATNWDCNSTGEPLMGCAPYM